MKVVPDRITGKGRTNKDYRPAVLLVFAFMRSCRFARENSCETTANLQKYRSLHNSKNCLVHDRTRSLLGQAKRKGLCLTCDFKPSPCWKSFARDQVCDFYQTRNNQSQLFQVGSQWQLDTFNFGSKLCCQMHALFVVCPAIRNQERVAHRIYSLKT